MLSSAWHPIVPVFDLHVGTVDEVRMASAYYKMWRQKKKIKEKTVQSEKNK
jgi:hypothetical protein